MGFTAVSVENDKLTQSGFDNKQEALKYVEALVCDNCITSLKEGFITINENGVKKKEPITNVLETECGFPWFIITDEEFKKVRTIEDIFIAAGLSPADEDTLLNLDADQIEELLKKQEEKKNKEKKPKKTRKKKDKE